ncbi:hypothetical protein POM88_029443 [Heracleum sosnowskyi]|uniref:Uncharacterized protein n=1 Tax=Heracleum sosnowskyi TaxID=360622 RepID=A0AAD8HTX7_9APIA|nr:hypothetical protein POM88_029443 [Heracleum sosnowskyi]
MAKDKIHHSGDKTILAPDCFRDFGIQVNGLGVEGSPHLGKTDQRMLPGMDERQGQRSERNGNQGYSQDIRQESSKVLMVFKVGGFLGCHKQLAWMDKLEQEETRDLAMAERKTPKGKRLRKKVV